MKAILLASVLLTSTLSYGQLFTKGRKWSAGLNIGSQDLLSHTNSNSTKFYQLTSFHANGRYMFNNWFGLQSNLGYQLMLQDEPTHVNYASFTLSGVFDLSELATFIVWPVGFRVLGHLDQGFASMWKRNHFNELGITPGSPYFKSNDDMLVVSVGLTPEYRLTHNIMINFDVTYVQHILQDQYFDWSDRIRPRSVSGSFMRFSIGATYYFGSEKSRSSMN
jgi:hypothetical protein